jgi:hypothetical protein
MNEVLGWRQKCRIQVSLTYPVLNLTALSDFQAVQSSFSLILTVHQWFKNEYPPHTPLISNSDRRLVQEWISKTVTTDFVTPLAPETTWPERFRRRSKWCKREEEVVNEWKRWILLHREILRVMFHSMHLTLDGRPTAPEEQLHARTTAVIGFQHPYRYWPDKISTGRQHSASVRLSASTLYIQKPSLLKSSLYSNLVDL